MRRLGYRLYRHPLVMFGLGPAWLFLLKQRLPVGMMNGGALPWVSTMATNVAIGVCAALMAWAIGFLPFLLIHLPIVLLSGAAGIWLFYVQHQFEDTHWSAGDDWHFPQAALHGASHYDLPLVLRWLTGNIGIHHVPSPVEQDPLLQTAGSSSRPPTARAYRPDHSLGKLAMRQARPLG
ncbi:fatty acid desaturase [Sinorhizobium fredii]